MDIKEIILEEIQHAVFKGFKSNSIYFSDGDNLKCDKKTELGLRKLHDVSRNEPILLAFYNEEFQKGDFFTADRTFVYSTLFLERGISVVKRTITDGWDKSDTDNIDIAFEWESLEEIQYSSNENLFYLIHYNQNDPSYIHSCYFGITKQVGNTNLLTLLNNIVKGINNSYSNQHETIESFLDGLSELVDNEQYLEALQIMKDSPKFDDIYRFVLLKIQALKGAGDIQEALWLIDRKLREEKDESSQQFNGYLLGLKGECLNILNKNYEALINYQKAYDYFGDVETKRDLKKEIINSYDRYIEEFSNQRYEDRKVVLVNSSGTYFKSDNLLVLNQNNLPNITFPISHPKQNETYVCHPHNSSFYIPLVNYDYELLNDRINEFCYLLQCLGATEIEITNTKGSDRDSKHSSDTTHEGGITAKVVSISGQHQDTRSRQDSNSEILKISKSQYFNPTQKPYIPNDLIWFSNEVGWQRLAQQRLSGNLLIHSESISTQSMQILTNSDLNNIKADLSAFLLSVNYNYNSQKDSEIKNNENSEWMVRVVFKPIEEFDNQFAVPQQTVSIPNQSISTPQTAVVSTIFSENDQKMIEQLEKAFEDGIITDMEERILKRLQQRFAISDARYEELKNYVQQSQMLTEDERAYLEEYQIANQNNDISDEEREFLRSFALQLGISPERVEEIEKKA